MLTLLFCFYGFFSSLGMQSLDLFFFHTHAIYSDVWNSTLVFHEKMKHSISGILFLPYTGEGKKKSCWIEPTTVSHWLAETFSNDPDYMVLSELQGTRVWTLKLETEPEKLSIILIQFRYLTDFSSYLLLTWNIQLLRCCITLWSWKH